MQLAARCSRLQLMSLEHLTGRSYGPFVFELSAAKVAEYVAATGDQPDRWTEFSGPPCLA